jgi:beta-galactosidase
VNWKPYNKPKAPGLDTLSSLQAVFHGSDSVQYFQWRKSRGSSEKLHGAVVGHDGTADTRVFRSVKRTGEVLKQISDIAGTLVDAPVALILDWENLWALADCQGYAQKDKKYFETLYSYHRVFWEKGINCDIVSPDADLSRYKLVVAPMLYLTSQATAENLRQYVAGGGTLYSTYMTGTVDENDLCHLGGIPGCGLKDVFGIIAEEIDTLYPGEIRHAQLGGVSHRLMDYCETLRLQGAEVLCAYEDGYYQGSPAVTCHSFGEGYAIYQACRDEGSLKTAILETWMAKLGIRPDVLGALPHGVTCHSRTDSHNIYVFLENYLSNEASPVQLRQPMVNLLTGETEISCTLPPYGYRIYQYKKEGAAL